MDYFVGAGFGGVLRHSVNVPFSRVGSVIALGTLTVNVVGSLIMRLLTGYFMTRTGLSQHFGLFLTTGVLGGFTTFSAFSRDAAVLFERQAYRLAAVFVGGSALVGLLALFAGLALSR